jgi:hypothetical protein
VLVDPDNEEARRMNMRRLLAAAMVTMPGLALSGPAQSGQQATGGATAEASVAAVIWGARMPSHMSSMWG